MSTPAEQTSERASHQRSSSECKPLIDAATKDLFSKNAFRLTGLAVDATTREITKHADKIKMLAELGHDRHMQSAAFSMKRQPSLDQIREAIQKLRDPEKRLIDEFFWIWPEEFGNRESDPAMRALASGDSKTAVEIWTTREKDDATRITAKHNLALVYHLRALEQRQKITDITDSFSGWKGAFDRWESLVNDDRFWEKVAARIRQLNEPNLRTDFARMMRAALPEALGKINAELALASAESGEIELARLHIRFMRETSQGLDTFEKTAELVLRPARNRLKEQIQRAATSVQQNPATAHEAAGILIEHAHPMLEVFELFFGEQEHFQKELFDEAATTAVNCLVAYQRKTGDSEAFVKLLERTLPFAKSIEVRRRIEENIGIGKNNLLHRDLAPISSVPSLSTYNGIGFTLYGSTDSDPTTGSYLTTYYFVFVGIPIFPICRYRVTSNGSSYRFFGKAPLRQFDKWHLATSIGLIICLIIAISSAGSGSTSPSPSSYTPPPQSTPAYTPSSGTPSAPIYTPPPTFDDGNSDGKVYRVPSSVSSTLDSEKAEIESERTTLEALGTQIETLGREIERDRIYLDRTSQFALDAFNSKVDRYNALNQRAKLANAAFNEKVDSYNAKLQRYGR